MPAISSTAVGKAILFGEHAVVYQQPAIAVPITQIRARAYVQADPTGKKHQITIDAPDIDLFCVLKELPDGHEFKILFTHLKNELRIPDFPSLKLRIKSEIPIASGLGSGAAVSTAIIRVTSNFLGAQLSAEQVSSIAFEVEKKYHGTPSGIDNTVIAYEKPIFFIKGTSPEHIKTQSPLHLLVADSGISSQTAAVVLDVRTQWLSNPNMYNAIFEKIGSITRQARHSIEKCEHVRLGELMNRNHQLLQQIDVSHAILDKLVTAAKNAGALGAKLSGAGRGGNIVVLVDDVSKNSIETALRQAGAKQVFRSIIQ